MRSPARPEPIEHGWLGLHDLPGCELPDEPSWSTEEEAWVFTVRLRADVTSTFVPEYTEWVITVDASYPAGAVEVYPACEHSLMVTFHHQSHNAPAGMGSLRRGGKLCLTVAWGEHRAGDRTLPPDRADERLRWTLERARRWLHHAATGSLVAPGDPFELPDFAAHTSGKLGSIVVSGARHEQDWLDRVEVEWGELEWCITRPSPAASRVTLLRERPRSDEIPRFHPWGSFLTAATGTMRGGAWLWLPSPPIVAPWQVPRTWGDLRAWARDRGIDLERPLAALRARFRGETTLLVGFPVPGEVSGVFTRTAWQALEMPASPSLASGKRKRPAQRDPWADEVPLRWLTTQVWSPDRLRVRGVADPRLAERTITLIGIGAVGSRLADLLVRAGVRRLHLIDGDTVQAGNLVRHSATLRALGVNKAEALLHELQAACPFAQITASTTGLSTDPNLAEAMLGDADLIIDSTASDAVLRTLSMLPGGHPRRWMSVSLSRQAERLYVHLAYAPRFPLADFEQIYRPWHADDAARHREPLPWEGAGCWSPIFPARGDDIASLVALVVRELERLVVSPAVASELRVYERECDDDGTVLAIRRVTTPDRRISALADSTRPAACSGPDHSLAVTDRSATPSDFVGRTS